MEVLASDGVWEFLPPESVMSASKKVRIKGPVETCQVSAPGLHVHCTGRGGAWIFRDRRPDFFSGFIVSCINERLLKSIVDPPRLEEISLVLHAKF